MTITVTWMDGQQESYPCESWSVTDGVLLLVPPRRGADPQPKRGIPLHNVRIWTE